jgi:hypothetical protein
MIVRARNKRSTAFAGINDNRPQAEASQVDGSGEAGRTSSDNQEINLPLGRPPRKPTFSQSYICPNQIPRGFTFVR